MRFLLDTDICIYIIKRKPQQIAQRFNTLRPSDVAISAITVAELEYGAQKSQKPDQNRAALQQFLIPLDILVFDPQAAQAYGTIRADLERKGQVIGSLDMLIAAQAQSEDITLVTNNVREFSRQSDDCQSGDVVDLWID
jgi:tRNA(fMet)-specific endonuclease VapC